MESYIVQLAAILAFAPAIIGVVDWIARAVPGLRPQVKPLIAVAVAVVVALFWRYGMEIEPLRIAGFGVVAGLSASGVITVAKTWGTIRKL